MEAAKEKAQFVNGINTEQLFSTIDLIKENPDIAGQIETRLRAELLPQPMTEDTPDEAEA